MTLTDAGPLIALLDADEADHQRCRDVLDEVTLPMVTTWPAFTEAMHLLGRGRWRAQQALWRLVERGDLEVADLPSESVDRAAKLMGRYADRPMDLADASVVALAEHRGLQRIFTLDRDFQIYRMRNRRHFDVLPR